MASVNRVILVGTLTRDPQVKMIGADRAVANFGLAMNRKYKNKAGELVEEATFVDIEAFGKTAEVIGQYLTKGKQCYVEGYLKLDTWEKDGEKRQKLKVVAEAVQFLSPRERSDAAEARNGNVVPPPAVPADDEPPF